MSPHTLATQVSWNNFLESIQRTDPPFLQPRRLEINTLSARNAPLPVVVDHTGAVGHTWGSPHTGKTTKTIEIPAKPAFAWPTVRTSRNNVSAGWNAAARALASISPNRRCLLNHYLLGSPVNPAPITACDLVGATDEVTRRHRDMPVVLHSLTQAINGNLMSDLTRAGFLLMPTGVCWLGENAGSPEWFRLPAVRRVLRQESRAQNGEQTEWVLGCYLNANERQRVLSLEQMPIRTTTALLRQPNADQMLQQAVAADFLRMWVLREKASHKILGAVGIVSRAGVASLSLLAIAADAEDREQTVNRLLMCAFLKAADAGDVLRYQGNSTVAAGFGATPHQEYAAVWAHHLSWRHAAPIRALRAAANRAVKIG